MSGSRGLVCSLWLCYFLIILTYILQYCLELSWCLIPWKKITVKPVLSGHLKINKTKVLMENGSLMKVESIAECPLWSIMQYVWPALSDNRCWKPIFDVLFEWLLKTGFTVNKHQPVQTIWCIGQKACAHPLSITKGLEKKQNKKLCPKKFLKYLKKW